MYFFQFLYWCFFSKPKINCPFFLMKPIPIWACLSICHTVYFHRFHNSILFLSYLLLTLFGGLYAYFDKCITTSLFLNWIKNDHDDPEDVKNYIGSLNKNEQYTLNYNDYLDSTNMGPDLFANIELRNTYQTENNFVSNIRNFSWLNVLSLNIQSLSSKFEELKILLETETILQGEISCVGTECRTFFLYIGFYSQFSPPNYI